MKNKGFTLVELISIIALLGLIALIAVPNVNTMINDSREKAYNEQIRAIEESARTYMSKNSLELPDQTEGNYKCVSIAKLKKAGLLSDEDIKNPKYKKSSKLATEMNETFNGSVLVTFKGNKYTYQYEEDGKCNVNGVVYRYTTDRLNIGDSIEGIETTTDPSTLGKNHYLKHEVKDNKITASYTCFVTDQEYCMQGGSGHYLENKALIQSQQSWFLSHGGNCNDFTSGPIGYFCRTDNLYIATGAGDGENTSDNTDNCPVLPSGGLSYCAKR